MKKQERQELEMILGKLEEKDPSIWKPLNKDDIAKWKNPIDDFFGRHALVAFGLETDESIFYLGLHSKEVSCWGTFGPLSVSKFLKKIRKAQYYVLAKKDKDKGVKTYYTDEYGAYENRLGALYGKAYDLNRTCKENVTNLKE